MIDGNLSLAGATLGAAGIAAWASLVNNKRIKTNHGKTIGQHVEEAARTAELAAERAAAAKFATELVALQLAAYKVEQQGHYEALSEQFADHATNDSAFQSKAEAMWKANGMSISEDNPAPDPGLKQKGQ